MDLDSIKELKETDIWILYNKATEFARKKGMYEDADRNDNFFNGDQWEGLIIEEVEPVSYNFIRPIINYKVAKIVQNYRAINYGADNIESSDFRPIAKKVCDLLNQRATKVWKKNHMDLMVKRALKRAAIDGESILYSTFDDEENNPKPEILNMLDVYYGNENDYDIQNQPYILIKQRMSVIEAKELAENYGVSEKDIEDIKGDEETTEEAGKSSKEEVNDMVTVVTKLFKQDGTVWFSKATKYVELKEETDSGVTLYPLVHMLWDEKEGSARGVSEVKGLIPNQIETNKTIMRRLLTIKNNAYPQKIYNSDLIENPESINTIGGSIRVKGMNVQDVSKIFTTTNPSTMSSDAEKIQQELIQTTRELANASDTATGQVNPEDASGRAILAVQQASQEPLNEQNTALNTMLEELASIWFEMWQVYNEGTMKLEDVQSNPMTGEDEVQLIEVPETVLQELKVNVKIDITPKGAYDKYAQEMSIENLAKSEFFMNTSWLEDYLSLLDNDAVMPKLKMESLVKRRKEAQKRIQAIQQQGALQQQQVQQMMESGQIVPRDLEQYMGQPEQGQPMQQEIPQEELPTE